VKTSYNAPEKRIFPLRVKPLNSANCEKLAVFLTRIKARNHPHGQHNMFPVYPITIYMSSLLYNLVIDKIDVN